MWLVAPRKKNKNKTTRTRRRSRERSAAGGRGCLGAHVYLREGVGRTPDRPRAGGVVVGPDAGAANDRAGGEALAGHLDSPSPSSQRDC